METLLLRGRSPPKVKPLPLERRRAARRGSGRRGRDSRREKNKVEIVAAPHGKLFDALLVDGGYNRGLRSIQNSGLRGNDDFG